MADARHPEILVFDVNETLLDLTHLEPLFERLFGSGHMMREWFAQLILYSQTMTLAGRYAPFGTLGAAVLRMTGTIHDRPITEDDLAELKERVTSMPAHADAAPALEALRDAGFRLVTLTNSNPGPQPTPLEKAGLAQYFERSYSIDAVRRFKPAPECYRLVAEDLDTGMDNLCLVACHLWDTAGAQAAGCRGAMVTRPHNALLPVEDLPEPDVVAGDMGELARRMIAAWR
ncbi:haloacid dehalogenase type II [Roseivivax sp. CAU 1761]